MGTDSTNVKNPKNRILISCSCSKDKRISKLSGSYCNSIEEERCPKRQVKENQTLPFGRDCVERLVVIRCCSKLSEIGDFSSDAQWIMHLKC